MIMQTQMEDARKRASAMYREAGIVITPEEETRIEIADFGLSDLEKIGLEVLVYVNTNRVCAKELAMFPQQTCPEHIHPSINGKPGKEETFRCRWGKVYLYVDGEKNCEPKFKGLAPHDRYLQVSHEIILDAGQQYTLFPDTLHWFRAGENGAVVSEFSTASTDETDVFTDPDISRFTKIAEV